MGTGITPKNAWTSNLLSGFSCNHFTSDSFFLGNRIIAGALITSKQDPFNLGSVYYEIEFYDVTLAELWHGYEIASQTSNTFDSDKQNPYYIRREEEWIKGVKICCDGEMELEEKRRFLDIDVKILAHSIF
jgi:hypothetical protein